MTEMDKMKGNPFFQSPIRLVIGVGASIFVAEAGVMVLLSFFPNLPKITVAFIDSILLLFLLIPSLTFFVFRPLILHITERKRVEEALRKSEEQLRYLSNQILTVQETERRRISRQLHEELGQILPALKLQLRVVEKQLREDQGAIKVECENILKNIDQFIVGIHRLSYDLSPPFLEDFGVSTAIRHLADEFSKRHNVEVSLDVDDIDPLFLKEGKVILYRILQEALSNIERHAQAKHVSIIMKKEDKKASLAIEDDGKGFDVSQTLRKDAAEKGWGLPLMEERIRMLNGALDVRSQAGKGTRLTFTIPAEK
jgi:signal transduction histidine kinase